MKRCNWQIGSDPELFLYTPDGHFINAFEGFEKNLIKGTKARPEPMPYGAIQVDGMAIEFNTVPTDSPLRFRNMIQAGMQDACIRFGKAVAGQNSIAYFDQTWLLGQHPAAIELGCDPDFNAWKHGEPNPRPDLENPCRTAGGHVHIGWRDPLEPIADVSAHVDECCAVIRHLDYALGVWSVPLDVNGTERRQMYGSAGAFRPKDYGVEYRVLSNFWIFKPTLSEDIVVRSLASMNAYADGLVLDQIFGDEATKILKNDKTNLMSVLSEVNRLLDPYIEEVLRVAA